MGTDITRSTFKKEKHYSSVRMQQGRVQLDADWNEQIDIQAHINQTETQDLIGPCGAPYHRPKVFANFQIRAVGGDFEIAPGKIYIDGVLYENEEKKDGTFIKGTRQPDVPDSALIVRITDGVHNCKKIEEAPDGTYVAYLAGCQRDMTVLEDEEIREKALKGADTATRTKTIWQIRLEQIADGSFCGQFCSDWKPCENLNERTTGLLSATTEDAGKAADDCGRSSSRGYRRLENQLYRVEVHDAGKDGEATFKWSRDNGSMAAKLSNIQGQVITVSDPGRDLVQGFAKAEWIELADERMILLGLPGILRKVVSVDGNRITVEPKPDSPVSMDSFNAPPAIVRRWDGCGTISGTKALEDGIKITFNNGYYRTGDFWLIPARTTSGDIEWPKDDKNTPRHIPPHGIERHYAPLAILTRKDGNFTEVKDCRKLFPPVSELTSFFLVGGEGQEAMPGRELPHPMQVCVANGQWPVPNARVRFKVLEGGGDLRKGNSDIVLQDASGTIVRTDPNGVADCRLKVGTNEAAPGQRIEVALLDDGNNETVHHKLFFNANLSIADQVAYKLPKCKLLQNQIPTLQELLKKDPPAWPQIDEKSGDTTVKELLDVILCRLSAARIPYDPVVKENHWKDVKEIPDDGSLGKPPAPNTVQDALDDLVENLERSDIGYVLPKCTHARLTLRDLIKKWPEPLNVKSVLDVLLCRLDSNVIPYDTSEDLTIRKALDSLKDAISEKVSKTGDTINGDIKIQTSLNVTKKVTAGSFSGDGIVPGGMIALWYRKRGTDIPKGWVIVDGKNGTPDPRLFPLPPAPPGSDGHLLYIMKTMS